jgi:SAM-dependent methyltransferase
MDETGAAEQAGRRWDVAGPDPRLTWGRALTGDAFIAKLFGLGASLGTPSILEIGPGYGRLLRSIRDRRLPFADYVGVDRSAANCAQLKREFAEEPRISFVCADAAAVRLERPFDLMISSLTLKHVYPTFEPVLANLVPQARPGAWFVLDLLECDLAGWVIDLARRAARRIRFDGPAPSLFEGLRPGRTGGYGLFEVEGGAYVRRYTKPELRAILARSGLGVQVLDHVRHDRSHRRLLVVARRR